MRGVANVRALTSGTNHPVYRPAYEAHLDAAWPDHTHSYPTLQGLEDNGFARPVSRGVSDQIHRHIHTCTNINKHTYPQTATYTPLKSLCLSVFAKSIGLWIESQSFCVSHSPTRHCFDFFARLPMSRERPYASLGAPVFLSLLS
ncbi:hypothetical protein SAMD00019534_006920, partial [Acytostelium subglobosum LB1]|uniref:hypothetical protein n=1 Tax=Acytostelium subglobosum LB1 TaxID=1410327 RepID=UPI000644BB2C